MHSLTRLSSCYCDLNLSKWLFVPQFFCFSCSIHPFVLLMLLILIKKFSFHIGIIFVVIILCVCSLFMMLFTEFSFLHPQTRATSVNWCCSCACCFNLDSSSMFIKKGIKRILVLNFYSLFTHFLLHKTDSCLLLDTSSYFSWTLFISQYFIDFQTLFCARLCYILLQVLFEFWKMIFFSSNVYNSFWFFGFK